jgi:alpha-glucosidase
VLSLPGSVYLYQGEELGLPEVLDLDPGDRQDPIWHRSNGAELGRDGCRVPLPWSAAGPGFGFTDAPRPWLPQPQWFGAYAVEAQRDDPQSMMSLYREAVPLRAKYFSETLPRWVATGRPDVLALTRDSGVTCVVNTGDDGFELPTRLGEVVLASGDPAVAAHRRLAGGDAVWLLTEAADLRDPLL